MPYELKVNEGDDNQDCFIISVGRVFDSGLSEAAAKARGWAEIKAGIRTETDLTRLQTLYTSLYLSYSEELELIISQGVPAAPPQTLDELQRYLMQLIEAIEHQPDLLKGCELLGALPESFLEDHQVILVDKGMLEQPGGVGQLCEQVRERVLLGISPQFLAQNGGHFSTVVPSSFGLGFTGVDQYEAEFIELMQGPLGEATGYTPPLHQSIGGASQASDFSYSQIHLSQHVQEYRDLCGNELDIKVEQSESLDGCDEFIQRTQSSYESLDKFYQSYSQLPEQDQAKLSLRHKMAKASQEKLDSEMAVRLQLQEVESFKQQKPECNIQVNDRQSLLLFFKQYEDDGYCLVDCGQTPGLQ
ncbi:hypothetical protein PsalN5692_00787 [Piscirickettsia salmonis]|uniref:hypothetical protein n=1 Tax=Piscirickettsia salmonis TaxID=1238 RepID=UPI0012B98E1D|nr:hypothetical protein [Piscirickettsia salmonis]QGP49352.1 hypothetical protein PsalN5692_00787 [Piscirickettsia salmonis]